MRRSTRFVTSRAALIRRCWPRRGWATALESYAVALGSQSDDPMAAVPLGVGVLLPTGMPGSGGEVRFVGLQRRQNPLTSRARADIEGWAHRLDPVDLEHVELGLTRLCRSIGERNDPADSLVDAAIAWENLVEHSSELTRSVAFGMSALVGDAGKKERDKAYAIRSAIVHGDHVDTTELRASKVVAVATAIAAFRSLVVHHPEKIALSSEKRVVALGMQLRPKRAAC